MVSWKSIEKHNIISVIERYQLIDFDKNELNLKIRDYFKGYLLRYYILEDLLQELVSQKVLSVKYVPTKKTKGAKSEAFYTLI